MVPSHLLSALVFSIGLSACVAPPATLPTAHPASPAAAEGLVDASGSLANYRTSADFSANAAADHAASGGMKAMPGMDHSGMDHSGMDHGGMSHMRGMKHEAAPGGSP